MRMPPTIETLLIAMLLGIAAAPWFPQAIAQSTDPIAADAVRLSLIGDMIGTLRAPKLQFHSENFGKDIWPLGDVDSDGLADWAVSRIRIDTVIQHPSLPSSGSFPIEVLLYKGVRGGLPSTTSGIRLGPTEIGAETRLIASSDFDDDGSPDIVLSTRIRYDTAGNNPQGILNIYQLFVMWGNSRGEYRIDDTTRLRCEQDQWGWIHPGAAADVDDDGVDDLIVRSSRGFTDGVARAMPTLRIFTGHRGRRWGRDPLAPRTAQWTWWSTPEMTSLSTIDHDCDGNTDIVFTYNSNAYPTYVAIVYGREGALPDTTDYERVDPTVADARASIVADVTGDGTPELVSNCGGLAVLRVYAGRPGQRLIEQYGSGADGPLDGHGWWRRPWAEIWTPSRLDTTRIPSGYSGFFHFGDIDGDGLDEIWIAAYPQLVGYRAGRYLDSIVDYIVDVPRDEEPIVARLGDIDGSGRAAIAMQYDEAPAAQNPFPGGMRFFVSLAAPVRRSSVRTLPHIDGEHCAAPATIEAPSGPPRAPCIVSSSDGTIVIDCGECGGNALRNVSLVDATGATLGSIDAGGACRVSIAPPEGASRLFVVLTRADGSSELVPVISP